LLRDIFRTDSPHRTEKTQQMVQSSPAGLVALLTTYGYWAVFAEIAIESTGIPFPGETMLLVASISAGATHHLSIVLVIVAAAAGAILGDNLGYWIGATGGARLLLRNPRLVRRTERKLKLGLALFQQHGGTVVFFGRFVAVLRMWAAVLAGISHLRWSRFLLFNALGGLVWATGYGLGGYVFGTTVDRLAGPLGWGLLGLAGCVMGALVFLWRRREQGWEEQAARMFPDPLEQYLGSGGGHRARQCGVPPRGRRDAQEDTSALPHQAVLAPSPSTAKASVPKTPPPTRESSLTSGPARKPLRSIHLERISSW